MLELGSSGSVRGVSSNGHPYRDPGPLVDPAGRGVVRELGHGRHDPAPGRRPVIVAGKSQFVSSCGAFVERLFSAALDHEQRRPPNVDLRYQGGRLINWDLQFAKRLKRAILPCGAKCRFRRG